MAKTIEGFTPSYDGTRIHYCSEGEGFPLAICNGILCSTGYWVYLRRFFRDRCRVITFDYRGHGRSELPRHPGNVTVGSFASDLKAVLDALEIPEAVLAGHSMGVQVILEFYRRYAGRVLGLIPILGTYGNPFKTFYGFQWPDRVAPPLLRASLKHADVIGRVFKPLLGTPLSVPLARLSGAIHWYLCPTDIMKDYFQQISTMDFRMGFRALLAMAEHSAEDVLGTIQVPTLIVAGEKDPFTPPWLSEKMWQAIPGAELLTIPQGTHTALVENPVLLHTRMESFLRDHFLSQGYQPLQTPRGSASRLSRKKPEGTGKPATGGKGRARRPASASTPTRQTATASPPRTDS
jgi:pimeloyl-ACP methyl ester carboxylesterase